MLPAPAIDYTNKDFASLRQAMLDLARYRLPEWTDQSPADLGNLLVDLFAYMGDIVLYYQDRIANELFLATATERRSVQQLLRLVGYELRPPVAAAADLNLLFNPPAVAQPSVVTVPFGAQFTAQNNGQVQTFEYLGPDLQIDLNSAQVRPANGGLRLFSGLPVRHSQSRPQEILGSSSGEPNQSFRLSQAPVLLDSLVVEVNEGAGWVTWARRENLLYYIGADGRVMISGPDARDYAVQFDEQNYAWVVFGDGVFGRRPPTGVNNLRATYRTGGGAAGNVPSGAIISVATPITLLNSVTNPLPAAGGADAESLDHAVRFGPLAFRSGQRAVTLADFVALAHQAGGIAKVRARSVGWNQVELFIAPEGIASAPAPIDLKVPEDLRKRILSFFEDRRMASVFVQIQNPVIVPIDVTLEITPDPHYHASRVRQEVESTLQALFAFERVDFGYPLYLSDVYSAVEALASVVAVNVTRFRRQSSTSPAPDLQSQLQSLNLAAMPGLNELIQRAMTLQVEADGRIEIGEVELPTLGRLEISLREG
jgi:uncharacterized phage protein gp47/JayE